MKHPTHQLTIAIVLLAALACTRKTYAQFDLSWRTVDGGGGTSTGGSFSLSGTIAQPDASSTSLVGGTFAVSGGFWPGIGGPGIPTCLPDIAPLPNGNGIVNIDDLLAVINNWGPCANPNDCRPDIAPPGGNDVVNIDDLLAVINGWGNCP